MSKINGIVGTPSAQPQRRFGARMVLMGLCAVMLVMLLGACGQKGPLTLPPPVDQKPPTPTR